MWQRQPWANRVAIRKPPLCPLVFLLRPVWRRREHACCPAPAGQLATSPAHARSRSSVSPGPVSHWARPAVPLLSQTADWTDPPMAGVGWRLSVLVLVLACCGCHSAGVCSGEATCFGANVAQCQNVPGCVATAGCMVNPVTGPDCATGVTAAECSAISGCGYSSMSCTGPCSGLPSQSTCEAMPTCIWSVCTGTPKPCTSYSSDSCPTSPLGCFVDTTN